ncbi:type IIA DNA topoisomerase subunit B [Bacteroidota bacterium]
MATMKEYSAGDIQVLEGLDPVRKRPGMYIGGTGKAGLHHLLWEVVDNAVDEASNGFASAIEVTLHADGRSVTVSDNGRGIPVEMHPIKKVPTLELILTTLHAGGKFDDSSYITSGGLHGVGASVVNALSEQLTARVRRGGKSYRQDFARGVPVSKLTNEGSNGRGSGTSIYFRPDTEIFEIVAFDSALIARQLEVKTYLNASLRITFSDETSNQKHVYHHEGGIAEFLDHLIEEEKTRKIHPDAFVIRQPQLEQGYRVEVALQWTENTRDYVRSFVNGIPTQDGGTHETGFRDGVARSVRSYMETHGVGDKKLEVTADDIREGLFGIVNLFVVEPQFQGQTKEKLNNPEARSIVTGAFRLDLEQYLNEHPSTADAIAARIIQSAKARLASRAASKAVRRKTAVSHRLNLPGKLADCSSTNPGESELFIVEGDSAGGSAKQGRDRKTQAILPLRGKVLNAEQATRAKVYENRELKDIVQALGCGMGDQVNLEHLRYHKVILLMDADSDGHHIATLLLTFFYRYLRPLIDEGFIYIAQPPLYRVDVGKEIHWALDDEQRDAILAKARAGKKTVKTDVQRFKGLGEMMPKTLNETTLNPATRRLLQVQIPDSDRLATENLISDLMGKNAGARYDFIMEYAAEADDLDV